MNLKKREIGAQGGIIGFLFWSLVVFFVIDIIALVGLMSAEFLCPSFSKINLSAYTPLAILAGALIALFTWIWNIQRQYSEDLFKGSQEFFEKSFQTLNVLDQNGLPENDRVRWLTSARLLRVAETIGEKIELRSHKLLHEETKDYWRSMFCDLIRADGEGFPESYFAEQPEHFDAYSSRNRVPLDRTSLAVLYRFCNWPEDRLDPIDDEPQFSEEEIEHMCRSGPRGLGRVLRRHHELTHEEP